MNPLQPVAAFEYNDQYGDSNTIALVHNDNSAYQWEVFILSEEDSDTYTTDGLRSHVQAIVDQWDPCPDSYHDEDDDEYDHDEDDCEFVRHADRREAWQALLQAALQFEANGMVTSNLATTASAVLGADAAWNHAALYPQARAVFSFDADRITIRNAVVRALENQGIDRTQIDQFTYEADNNPDILGVANRWVTCS